MNTYQVDLTNCNREPIHIPGKVQSHGFLVAVDTSSHIITYISENIKAFTGADAKNYLGKTITELEAILGLNGQPGQLSLLLNMGSSKNFDAVNPYNIELHGEPYFVVVNPSGNHLILEFEPTDSNLSLDVQKAIGGAISEILSGKNLDNMLNKAAHEIKKITRYDRVMIYKFNEDGHGEVIAEVKNDDLEPFMGLHYPASDIPKQARELYKINLTRIIADVNTENSPVITFNDDEPLDLTHSMLRAVSPIHIQYLKNMGVASSFSISLISHGELWGLVACHNYTPRFINYKARDAAKLLGQIMSSALEYRQEAETTVKLSVFNDAANEISAQLKKDLPVNEAITTGKLTIADITTASGVVLVLDGVTTLIGSTPTVQQIEEIISWLKINMADTVYATHRFPEVFEPAKSYSAVASGLLACALSKSLADVAIWFKPEQLTSIKWAGNPDKPAEPGEGGLMQISPRKSFEAWEQIVKNTAIRWSNEEINAVIKVREEIIYAVNRRANEIRILNEKLQIAYEELDTFSYTISHDLSTPLSSVKSYSQFLLASNKNLDEPAKIMLGKIVKGADKMHMLIKEILHYSHIAKTELKFDKVDMTTLINEATKEVINALNTENLQLVIGNTPDIYGDFVMLTQVFTNLVNNAVKYSARSNPSVVEIKGIVQNQQTIYSIADNGIGIDAKYLSRVFELFTRMDNVKDYEGSGVGLAIVKRIVEKHHARIWFESELGTGTTFYIAFNSLQP